MCMEDVRIGRRRRFIEHVVTLGASPVQVLQASPKRVAIVFNGAASAALCSYSTQKSTSFPGLFVPFQSPPVTLTVEVHGEMVKAGWFGDASGATPTVSVFEVLLDEE